MRSPLKILAAGMAFAVSAANAVCAQPLTIDQFREQLMAVPLCGTPPSGPLQGKEVCTVHLPDGTVVVAGGGVLARGIWEVDENRICRRSVDDPLERRRCVTYERIDDIRYKNSDGVEVCVGPCPKDVPAKQEPPPAKQEAPAQQ